MTYSVSQLLIKEMQLVRTGTLSLHVGINKENHLGNEIVDKGHSWTINQYVTLEFTEKIARDMAIAGWQEALELSREKGPAPVMEEEFTVTAAMLRKRPEMVSDGYRIGDSVRGSVLHAKYSRYMQQIAAVEPELVEALAKEGARFTHPWCAWLVHHPAPAY